MNWKYLECCLIYDETNETKLIYYSYIKMRAMIIGIAIIRAADP